MAGFYQTFTSARATEPDFASLVAQLRALDPTAGVQHMVGPTYTIKKATAWTAPQIAGAQTVINNAPAASAQLTAQAELDAMTITDKAIVLGILDGINVVRSKLSPPLAAITVEQMLAAIRTKAGTL